VSLPPASVAPDIRPEVRPSGDMPSPPERSIERVCRLRIVPVHRFVILNTPPPHGKQPDGLLPSQLSMYVESAWFLNAPASWVQKKPPLSSYQSGFGVFCQNLCQNNNEDVGDSNDPFGTLINPAWVEPGKAASAAIANANAPKFPPMFTV